MTSNSEKPDELMSVTVSLQADLLSALDAWRKRQPENPSRAAALIFLAARP